MKENKRRISYKNVRSIPPGRKYIFVSYSRANTKAVVSLIARLNAWGYEVWLDQFDIIPGCEWRDSIEKGIANADCFLLMISKAAVSSKIVEWELEIAEKNNIQIIPIIVQRTNLSKSLAKKLDPLQRITVVENPYRGAVKLIEALGGLNGSIPIIPGDKKYPALRRNAMLIGETIRFLQFVSLDGGNIILNGGLDWKYYVQLSISKESTDVYGEAVGNKNLIRKDRLGDDAIKSLHDFGWEEQTKTSFGNFQRKWPAQTDRDRAFIAAEILRTFLVAFKHPQGEDLMLELQLHS